MSRNRFPWGDTVAGLAEISDEQLQAYVDGEVTPECRRRIELGIAEDPALRARVSAVRMLQYFIFAAYRNPPMTKHGG